ncbi:M48 family metalloprotease, partial [Flavobacterium franklandianum]|uniref:hypothetical protein n=1 Tax=Flavobacterium franklandianum TaxID=2594430 RepID=UPI00163DBD19
NILSLRNNNPFKVLILSGGFDPITPSYFAKKTADNFNQNVQIINGYTYGHGLGFTRSGSFIINNFFENKPITDSLRQYFDKKEIKFKTNITLNNGIIGMTGDINTKQWYYFIPLLVSLLIIFVLSIFSLTKMIVKKNKSNITTLLFFLTSMSLLIFVVSIALGVYNTMNDSFYLLAFGFSSSWKFAFIIYKISLFLSIITFIISLIKVFKNNIPLYFMMFLSIGIIHYYFISWNFL